MSDGTILTANSENLDRLLSMIGSAYVHYGVTISKNCGDDPVVIAKTIQPLTDKILKGLDGEEYGLIVVALMSAMLKIMFECSAMPKEELMHHLKLKPQDLPSKA